MTTPASELILDQVCVAFGQGTGTIDVTRQAVEVLRAYYEPAIKETVVVQWDAIAAQALERVRAAGRLAAQLATAQAAAAIEAPFALQAARIVSETSATPVCPLPPPPPCDPEDPECTVPSVGLAADFAILLGQAFVAFGQGTGPVRVSRSGVAALRSRYGGRKDLIAEWEVTAPQILERVRAMGRMAMRLATSRGETAIGAEDVRSAAVAVEKASATPSCPPPDERVRDERVRKEEREESLAGVS